MKTTLINLNLVTSMNELFNDITDKNRIEILYKRANLTKIEIALFESYVFKYDREYLKMSRDLNSSRFIVKKQVDIIINKLIKASFKIDLY